MTAHRRLKPLVAGVLLALGLLPLARADIWGYEDEKGVAHFAAERLDERYRLFYREGQSFDTARGLAPAEPPGRAEAQPRISAAPPSLLALFESAPGYKQVRKHLREASSTHGIDYELLQALIATESGFDSDAVSPKGAVGLMQLMPATAERYGLSGDSKTPLHRKLTDPRTNIRTGTRYLSYLIQLFPGRLELALAAYNAGEGAVQRAGNRIPNYRETQNYVKTVMQLYALLKPGVAQATPGGRAPVRVRMEMPGVPAGNAHFPAPPIGGAVGRGNLPAGIPLADAGDQAPSERE